MVHYELSGKPSTNQSPAVTNKVKLTLKYKKFAEIVLGKQQEVSELSSVFNQGQVNNQNKEQ